MDASLNPCNTSSPTISFSFFVDLLSRIAKINPLLAASNHALSSDRYPALRVFQAWVAELRRKFGLDMQGEDAVTIFRLLFPERDVKRKYDMQEAMLSRQLSNALGVSKDVLSNWKMSGSVGCLGQEVMRVLKASASDDRSSRSLSIRQVDLFLDQLASFSAFSHESVRIEARRSSDAPRPREKILRTLFSSVSPVEASFLTQIILKDLRPVLYPVAETHYTAALMQYKSNAIVMLTVHDALKAWDPSCALLDRWKVTSRFEDILNKSDDGPPSVFTPLQIPKTIKGTGCAHALRLFRGARRVWAETKYDGERTQIHVKIDQTTGSADIKIFSKSQRDSSKDRIALNSVIRDALGLRGANPYYDRKKMINIERDIIIEAEMVAFSDSLDRIDEFWRIRSLIRSTAEGPMGSRFNPRKCEPEIDSQNSLLSDASDEGNRHLALVFYDILLLDSVPLTSAPYSSRRNLLESVIFQIPGYSMLAERSPIDLDGRADAALQVAFARVLSDHQEGLVLKAEDGQYIKSPWVKLKRDYIPSLGDCLDLVIVGARWDKERGRELRVPPSTFTTFYLGLLANEDIVKKDPNAIPHFQIFFTVSFGIGREQLEDLNFRIKNADIMDYGEGQKSKKSLGYTYDIFSDLTRPDVMLDKNSLLLAEVFGGGFTKARGGKYYELRFPRMVKVFRRPERSWTEGASLKEFQRIAREVVGRERPDKDVDDWCKEQWKKPLSPSVKHPMRRKQREETLLADLEKADKNKRKRVHEDDDKVIGSVKRPETGKNLKQSANPLQQLSPRPLQLFTNLASYPGQRLEKSARDDGSEQIQITASGPNDKETPAPLKFPLTSTNGKPRNRKISTHATAYRLPVAAVMSTPPPLVISESTNEGQVLPTNPQDSVFIDFSMEKRKKVMRDEGGATRKKKNLEHRLETSRAILGPASSLQVAITSSPTPVQGNERLRPENTVAIRRVPSPSNALNRVPEPKSRTVGAVKSGLMVPCNFPPPPPPGATGWDPRRRQEVLLGQSDSDKMALYNGASAYYTHLPRWECLQDMRNVKSNSSTEMPKLEENLGTLASASREVAITPKLERRTSSMFEPQNLLFADTAVGRLVATSIVWFAQDLDTLSPAYRPPWGQLIPQTNQVTRLESVLTGCGWHMLMNANFGSKSGVDRGIAFIDFEQDGEVGARVKMANIIKKCEETWRSVVKWKGSERMKPIWIVDARVLRWDVLETMRGGDTLEHYVLWEKG